MKKPSLFQLPAFLRDFLGMQSASGVLLLLATAAALLMANSGAGWLYRDFTHFAHLAVNDGLMVVFFFLVGLEIKREAVSGALSDRSAALLPVAAALGGMIVPVLIFTAINLPHPANLKGFAIPAATDIAFALGVLSLLGPRVPSSIRVFLLAIAVIDDLGAIVIIALFYSGQMSWLPLLMAAAATGVLFTMNKKGVAALWPYAACGIFLALCLEGAGIHTTIAGVVTAFAIPLPLIEKTEHRLHPSVSFGIMPLFAFVNAGVSFGGFSLATLVNPLPLGIIAGLFIGKQLGVFGASYAMIRLGLSQMPPGAHFRSIYGMAILCGIGFTISLFIGRLAFNDPVMLAETQLGVLAASLLSSGAGYLFLRFQKG